MRQKISFDGGKTYQELADITDTEILGLDWDAVVDTLIDNPAWQQVCEEYAFCLKRDALARYLELASRPLILNP